MKFCRLRKKPAMWKCGKVRADLKNGSRRSSPQPTRGILIDVRSRSLSLPRLVEMEFHET